MKTRPSNEPGFLVCSSGNVSTNSAFLIFGSGFRTLDGLGTLNNESAIWRQKHTLGKVETKFGN
ncbi:hypothetical protein SAMN05421740_1159 [Parapedobacter koreensis]|uniref:Uncharacterized protein n=1 Tax=Parapedobacter koreensis TaxID=332977 RepID=A0A1H7UE01_9SPHI|nr:hypothetical protein SAMN05421740_1159 [Parapedobacter koreensis]